jgi:hypothetical protein
MSWKGLQMACVGLVACTMGVVFALDMAGDANRYKGLGCVVVSPNGPDDGGDFGLNTQGTKTAGIQEALNEAKEKRRDVYIVGGGVKEAFQPPVVYTMKETLRVPWMQDFEFDSGQAVIQFNGKGDAVVFDSQMSCKYKFGLIVSSATGAVVRFAPRTKGPDNFSVITCNTFEFGAIVGSGSVFTGEGVQGGGTGLVLDGSQGAIVHNEILAVEIIACATGLNLTEMCLNNWIRIPFLHLCNTHAALGRPGCQAVRNNRIEAHIDGQGIKESRGVVIHGQQNELTLSFGQTSPGRDIVFESTAQDNLVTALSLPNGITNNALVPTNRIETAIPVGFEIETPDPPATGAEVTNRTCREVQVLIVKEGEVNEWSFVDAQGNVRKVHGGFFPGQTFLLFPGERVGLTYSKPPKWEWKALR